MLPAGICLMIRRKLPLEVACGRFDVLDDVEIFISLTEPEISHQSQETEVTHYFLFHAIIHTYTLICTYTHSRYRCPFNNTQLTSIYLSIYLFIYLSIYLFIYVSISIYIVYLFWEFCTNK